MKPRITQRQRQTYDFIRDFTLRFGQSPTYREICDHLKLKSIGTVQEILPYLERANLIRRVPNVSRGIELIDEGAVESSADVPLLGYVAAGSPIERTIHHETIQVPPSMVAGPGNYFALRVRGDSMRDEHILDRDTLICLSTSAAKDGDKVIALIDDAAATVKKFYREKKAVRLQPANERYKPLLITPPERVRVQGRVTGVLRLFG